MIGGGSRASTHTEASFATIGIIVVLQGTDHLIIGIGYRERASQ